MWYISMQLSIWQKPRVICYHQRSIFDYNCSEFDWNYDQNRYILVGGQKIPRYFQMRRKLRTLSCYWRVITKMSPIFLWPLTHFGSCGLGSSDAELLPKTRHVSVHTLFYGSDHDSVGPTFFHPNRRFYAMQHETKVEQHKITKINV